MTRLPQARARPDTPVRDGRHNSRGAEMQRPELERRTDLPVACSLGSADLARRAEELRTGVLAAATRVERLSNGVRFSFAESRDLISRLAPIIDAERRCCPFLRFDVVAEPNLGEVVLDITGPEGTAGFLEAWIPDGPL